MESYKYDKYEPNLEANESRHRKVFLKSVFFSRILFRFMLDIKSLFSRITAGKRNNIFKGSPLTINDPFAKIVKQAVAIGSSLLIITSFAPVRILDTGFTADNYGEDLYILEEDEEEDFPNLMINEEGFVLKPSPASEDVSRIGFTDSVKHTVVSGDTLSSIAALYGLSVKTLVWENSISETGTLKIGQTLLIPSVDGVSYTVTNGNETLSGIAKQFGVEADLIKEHNNLDGVMIVKGQKLFIPGGKKKEVVVRAGVRSSGRGTALNTFDTKVLISSGAFPSGEKPFIRPTTGSLTQGFHGGHYGQDIAQSSKPDVWAAAPGTVIVAKGGCAPRGAPNSSRSCGGGYGNFVVIDHGDGLQTLYGHLETIYVVEGQGLERGQAIGQMGNTGRVRGATGIHLHFEVVDKGVKRNPANYY